MMEENKTVTVDREYLKQLAQTTVDMSVMFMPVSALTMVAVGMMGKKAEKVLGVEIKPSEDFVSKFYDYQEALLSPYREKEKQYKSDLEFLLTNFYAVVYEDKELSTETKEEWESILKRHLRDKGKEL